MQTKNLFENIPENLSEETFEEIISSKNLKVERIISEGHSSPNNFWYDQKNNELVFLLKGSAELEFENEKVSFLKPGDFINIKAHQKHRVKSTSNTEKTIWLAIHY